MVGQSVTAAAALPTLSFKSRHGNNRTLGTYLMTNHTPTPAHHKARASRSPSISFIDYDFPWRDHPRVRTMIPVCNQQHTVRLYRPVRTRNDAIHTARFATGHGPGMRSGPSKASARSLSMWKVRSSEGFYTADIHQTI